MLLQKIFKWQLHQIKLNFEDKLASIDEVLKQAEKRNLTLFGKVCVIKSL